MGKIDYGPQRLDRREELERRAELAAGQPTAQELARRVQAAQDERLAVFAREQAAALAEAQAASKLRATTDGYHGDSLRDMLLLQEQEREERAEEARLAAQGKPRKLAKRVPRPKKAPPTVAELWDLIGFKVRAASGALLGKRRIGKGPTRNERAVLNRQGMKMGRYGWPTVRVPGAILRHKGDS